MDVKKVIFGSILMGSLAFAGVATAQTQEAERAAADARVDVVQDANYDRDDDGFDWGLLGLLGLLGLIPRKHKDVVVHDANRHNTNPNGSNRT